MATDDTFTAYVFPQDEGTGTSDVTDPMSGAALGLLSQATPDEYVLADYADGLGFVSRDAANDTITVGAGACVIHDDSSSTTSGRGSSGNPSVQSTVTSDPVPPYDVELPGRTAYLVVIPQQVTVDVSDSTLSSVWVNLNVTANNDVELRTSSGGGTTAAPSDTFIKLGEANADDASQDTRANDYPALTLRTLGLRGALTDDQGNTVYDYTNQRIGQNLVDTTSIDESIAPTWTGTHQFSGEIQDGNGDTMLNTVVASGSTTLSGSVATIDTGVAKSTTATFTVALAPDTDDADVGADVRSDSSSGNYEVDIQETDTDVGSVTVNYDIIRVR